jgi:hypothetical protein
MSCDQWSQTGPRIAVPLEDDVLEIRCWQTELLNDSPVDNTVQFSKTTALLGAAEEISTTSHRRQHQFEEFVGELLPRLLCQNFLPK